MMDNRLTTCQRREKRICQNTKDQLLSLPKNVIDTILIRLPLRDAVRTSILSHAWRYAWTDISEIVFNQFNFPLSQSSSQTEYDKTIVNIVEQVLLLHQGPILKFEFSVHFGSSKHHIDRWILHLSRNGTKKFHIDPLSGEKYKVPSGLFLCKKITHLELGHCIVIPPACFNGFNKIRTLSLSCITCSDDGLHALLSNCPLLNDLTLEDVENCTRLHLSAPNLVRLDLDSTLQDICFVDTPVLADVWISLWADDGNHDVANGATCELVKMFGGLPSISRMFLCGYTLEFLSVGNIPLRLPTTTKLLGLYLCMNFDNVQHMSIVLCIFRSSPHLQKVCLLRSAKDDMGILSTEDFWKAQNYCNGLFTELKSLKVKIDGSAAELKFIEIVLANAPVLQMVQVQLCKENLAIENKILKKVIRFRRLSTKAEVVIAEWAYSQKHQ